jgi:hypothetical protein
MEEPVLREVNRRIHDLTRPVAGPTEYLCECGSVDCGLKRIVADDAEFADALALQDTLFVAPGHESPGSEIVRQGQGYLIVRRAEVHCPSCGYTETADDQPNCPKCGRPVEPPAVE